MLLYIVDLCACSDAPLLQLYIAFMILFGYLILYLYSLPFKTKRGNWGGIILLAFILILIIVCVAFE